MMTQLQLVGRRLWILGLFACFAAGQPRLVLADNCAVCGQPIYGGTIWLLTDEVTGQKSEVCSNCTFNLPRCYLCGMPIKEGTETRLPDGRYLCARDAKTVVTDDNEIKRTCDEVKDDLDHLFSRFTSFPDNVDVRVIDRIDADAEFGVSGHDVESPDLLGLTTTSETNGVKSYRISLMIGLPLAELTETCAHEYSHTWVGDNVPSARHERLDRDAEEGFCEMVGYLLMESKGDEAEKQRVLNNNYTRGQVQLFIDAEKRFGFDEILDWMRYGETSRLEDGRLEEVRDVQMPATPAMATSALHSASLLHPPVTAPATPRVPTGLRLQGVMWGSQPSAIINGHSFFAGDAAVVKVDGTNLSIRCQAIQQKLVRVENLQSGKSQDLVLFPK